MKSKYLPGVIFICLVLVLICAGEVKKAEPRRAGSRGEEPGEVVAGAEARGEAKIARIRRVEGLGARGLVRTPSYRTDAPGGQKPPGEWVQITVYYDTEPEWVDELLFRYYVLTEITEGGQKRYSLFRNTVTYIDIEKGRNHMSTVFLRPSTVKRYGKPVAIGVEMVHQGKVIDEKTEKVMAELPEGKWWEHPRVVESKFVTIRDGYLLNRAQSPFALINIDDYEVIK
jgi:hypothetical protein